MRIGVGMPWSPEAATGVSNVISGLTDEEWLGIQADGHQTERIATSWAWDASGTTLRLYLRPNVFFHDNTQLTPEIAAQSLRQAVADKEAFSLSDVSGVKASGPNSVDITLTQPNAFLLSDLALVSVVKAGKERSATGPFVVVNRNPQRTVLRSYPRYYRGPPPLSEIDVKTYPTQRNAWAALMRSDIDMLYEVSRDAAGFVQAESTVHSYTFERPYYISLVFNIRHPILKNPAVRRALNQALDRNALVHDGLNGWGSPADGPISPEHWAYSRGTPFEFNPDGARADLDAAGYRLKPSAPEAIPSRFGFTCLVYTGDSRFERLAVLLQKQLADIGVDMQLVPVKDSHEWTKRLLSGNYDAFLFEMYGRSLSWAYRFWRSQEAGGLMNTGYRAADAALDQLKMARSDDETKAAVAELTRVMHEDPPAAFLAWQTSVRAVSTKFDVAPEKNRDIFSNVWQWRVAPTNEQAIQ